jgi:hypothetical protein
MLHLLQPCSLGLDSFVLYVFKQSLIWGGFGVWGNDNNEKSALFSHVTNTYSFKESSF